MIIDDNAIDIQQKVPEPTPPARRPARSSGPSRPPGAGRPCPGDMYAYIYIYMYISLSLFLFVYIYIYIYAYIHTYMYIYIYIYTYTSIGAPASPRPCWRGSEEARRRTGAARRAGRRSTYVYMYIHIYIYTYIYI